ncbi:uncharacterized protein LOC128241462 [Mya arenaria]|uniref:uncharacterized protein LOC128241462 n=1 Tax=Mya arenaria TaxID=6604 RepID=UPI0022E0C3AE|nr:uncharacterized protein LOC128241462 [Mya arenaria]
MQPQKVFTFLGVIVCGSALLVQADPSTTTAADATTANTTVSSSPVASLSASAKTTSGAGAGSSSVTSGANTTASPSAITTAFVPSTCTEGTCNGTDSSCLNDIKTTCPISAPDHFCQVSIDNNTVTAGCVTKPCTETATLKCCQSASCSSGLFKSNTDNKDNNGNGIQACIATIVTLATVVMTMIN